MHGVLKFNLPDERDEFKMACSAGAMHSVLWDMDQWLRNQLKYGNPFESADTALQAARDELFRLLNDHGVQLE